MIEDKKWRPAIDHPWGYRSQVGRRHKKNHTLSALEELREQEDADDREDLRELSQMTEEIE